MQRNSTTLFLESPGATTPVPWVDGAPDLSGFTEPTLSVLQQSWADFLASGQELEVIPDPPPPPPEHDWTAFNTAMLSDSNWQAWALPADLRNAMIAASINSNLTSLENAYAIAKAAVPPSAEAITGWQGLADTYNIPIVF
jgi:hypothetical protein